MENIDRIFDPQGQYYKINICRRSLTYAFNYPGTKRFFGKYLVKTNDGSDAICVTEEFITENRWLVNDTATSDFLEFQAIMLATGNYLLQYQCALFHGVSFIWHDLAWILTAPSGTGKSTQLVNWMNLYTDETQIINGDKTGLECSDDGSVYACSTPWLGKERYGFRDRSAKLGGIIVLEQGALNSLSEPDPYGLVYPLFIEFISYPDSEQQILDQAGILEQLIDSVPVWKFTNRGDETSTAFLHDALEEYLQNSEDRDCLKEKHADVPENARRCTNSDGMERAVDSNKNHITVQPGVVLLEIKGTFLLVAAKEARNNNCRYISRLNGTAAFLWKMIKKGLSFSAILRCFQEQYEIDDKEALEQDLQNCMKQLEKRGYIICDASGGADRDRTS